MHEEYVGPLKIRQPLLMASLTELKQGSDTVVQYIDKAKALHDDFEELNMESSLPLLCQQFIAGLDDSLQMSCAPAVHAIMRSLARV